MKKYIFLFFLTLPFSDLHAESKAVNNNILEGEGDYFKNETIESCYEKTVSVAIQNCLGYLSGEKEEAYEATYNQFLKDIYRVRKYFFDYKLFSKLIIKNKLDWDKYIKNECLAEATLKEKGGYGYSYVYDRCLVEGYESRIKFYTNYRNKIVSLSPKFGYLFEDK